MKLNPQQALQILAQLAALAPVNLASHKQGQDAINVLRGAISSATDAPEVVKYTNIEKS